MDETEYKREREKVAERERERESLECWQKCSRVSIEYLIFIGHYLQKSLVISVSFARRNL